MESIPCRHPAFLLIFLIFSIFLSGCGRLSTSQSEEPVVNAQSLQNTEKVRFSLETTPPENPEYEYDLHFTRLSNSGNPEPVCPPTEQVTKLKNFLDTNRVCFLNKTSPGAICTMQFISYPYAILVLPGNEIRLGLVNNGCGETMDFCAGRREEFVGLLKELVASAKSEFCL